ncbi:hypothetical protein GCM10025773_11840 [Microbacterium jejuense]
MSLADDAESAYNAWRETNSGSYLERTLADAIVRDLVPALIHALRRRPVPLGFGSDVGELTTDTSIPFEPDDEEGNDE